METPNTIRTFWFGTQPSDQAVIKECSHRWWSKNEAVDREIRQRFEPVMLLAKENALKHWAGEPQGLLALILLTDQFPRNAYRDTPQAFSFDPLARAWCKEGLQRGDHLRLRPIERVFFYLPLEHSESLADQEQSVALYEELIAGIDESQRAEFEGFLWFAKRHHEIIQRFGRFPHRNPVLGRESTPEEIAFLKEKGSSF
ncbi:DUF924 family protein [Oxalobacteraceae bacterium R-40]|uniref:DUF924 family protein n=1 Tax=Keguizhuia sedimenti TaxID=3064264 RepID=A0ABU1BMJ3_9BURK|nr:DUF924 family protein [Oxalobacteraceae bacterium R-40]